MKIDYYISESLPALAWAAELDLRLQQITVQHGKNVETAEHGLVEGAWNGSFPDYGFDVAPVFSGTGIRRRDGEILFCSSTDRLSPLFSFQADGKIHVSNSPIFLMSKTGTSPVPSYPYYVHDVLRISRQGLYCLDGTIPLENNVAMHLHISAILAVDTQGNISYHSHPPGPCPVAFDDYHAILKKSVADVLSNAVHPMRKLPMQSAAAISAGYDSCACAALARDAGCKEAHTFYDSKAEKPHQDSGIQIAQALGMSCKQFDRWEYTRSTQPVEAEFGFFSTNSNATLVAMEESLHDKIYVVGCAGDTYWEEDIVPLTNQYSKPWARGITGISQIEFRLRVGYQVFAPPYISAQNNQAIAKIVTSDEMSSWSVSDDYDRPVPRRIAELAGIPREIFGIHKNATGHSSLTKKRLFSKAGTNSYSAFKRKMHKRSGFLMHQWYRMKYAVYYYLEFRLLKRKRKILASTPAQRKYPFILNSPPLKCPWKFCFTFQWMHDELKERYLQKD